MLNYVGSRFLRTFIIAFSAVVLMSSGAFGWWQDTHDAVTKNAISALPTGLKRFYERNERLVVGMDNMPDMWRDTHRKEEGPHHYIDFDLLSKPPFNDVPRSYTAAEKKYGRAKLLKAGTLPWAIQSRYTKLVSAMRKKDLEGIVVQSAILAHYVGDGQNPLHVTSEYDGRTPEQKGIHSLLEGTAERRIFDWHFNIRPAKKIGNVPNYVIKSLVVSYSEVEDVYQADTAAAKFDPSRGEAYRSAFAEHISPLAKERIEYASSELADLYYTAWIAAGKPKLPSKAAPLFWGK